jgi:ligand-binding sensor domain-containing protein
MGHNFNFSLLIKKYKTISALFFALLVSFSSNAQSNVYGYEKVSTEVERIEKGLSQNSINTLYQDSYGFIWVGTWSGLNRYDGLNVVILSSNPDSIETSLSSSVINTLAEDGKGFLWIGTENGLNKLNLRTLKTQNFISSKKSPKYLNDTILSLCVDNQQLWVGTQKGLFINDIATDTIKTKNISFSDFLPSLQIRVIKPISIDLMAVGTDNGLYLINRKTYKIHKILQKQSLSSSHILSLLPLNNQRVLLGSEDGLFELNLQNYSIKNIPIQPRSFNANNLIITDLMLDKDSNIWIATSGNGVLISPWDLSNNYNFVRVGAMPLQGDKLMGKLSDEDYFYSLLQTNDGTIWLGSAWSGMFKIIKESNFFKKFQKSDLGKSISDNHIWTFFQDMDELWIGTEKGINIYNSKTHSLRTITSSGSDGNKLSSNQVRSIFKDSQGNFWIGTYKKGLNKYYPKKGKFQLYTADSIEGHYVADNTIWKIIEDNRKNLWIATHNGLQKTNLITGLTKVYRNIPGDSTSLSSNVVYNLYFDRQGNLWISTFDGLNLYLANDDEFKVFKRKSNNRKSLNTNRIFCIYQDTALNYWIGTIGGGLNYLDMVTGEVTHFTTANGLADNTIYAILPDDFGNIWMPTNYGISAFNIQNKTFINYTVNDGLTSNEFNYGASLKDNLGNMFFGGMFGFNVLTPKEFLADNIKPELRVAEYKIDDEIYGYLLTSGDEITLKHDQKSLVLNLTMLDYINPQKTVYKYRIINYDEQWRTLSSSYPVIVLTKLPPGNYRLEVVAMNSAGIWTEEPFVLNIKIKDAFYNMIIVRFLFGILLVLAIVGFSYRRFMRLRFKHRTERQLLELEKQTLRLQMNPHFIFNTLNSIQSFILKNDTDQSISYLSKFSKLMRMMLNFSREPYISLSDEINLIESYLELERLRLEKSFTFSIKIDNNIESDFIGLPPMIVQPFIENAIIHGLLPLKSREGVLSIDFNIMGRFLIVKIEDNGVGRQKNTEMSIDHKPSGILITQKRLELINKLPDKQNFYKITDLLDDHGNGAGTLIELKIQFKDIDN